MVRPSLIRDYEAKGIAPNPDDDWCWSMWHQYLENEDGVLVSSSSKRDEAVLPTFTHQRPRCSGRPAIV